MRDLLRLPALLVFFLVLLLLLLPGIDLLSTWGTGLSAGREEALSVTGARLLPALRESLPVAVLLALVLLLFRISLKPGNRFLSFVLPLAVAFVVLAFGYQVLEGLQQRVDLRRAESLDRSPGRFLVAERFNEAGGKILYLSKLEGGTLRGVVLYDPEARSPRLRFSPRGSVDVIDGGVRVSLEGTTWELASEAVYAPLFGNDPLVQPLLEDISLLNLELDRLFRESRSGFFLLSFALVFAFYSAGLFFRISRWPLLNVAVALFVLRGYLYLARLLGHDMVVELGKVFRNPAILSYLPALVLLILGAVFFLIDVLFVPGERWRREGA
jgi:hypothetical protein